MAQDNIFVALKKLGFEEIRIGKSGSALHYCGTWGGYAVSVSPRNGYWADVAVRIDKNDKQIAKTLTEGLKAQGFPKMKCINMGDHLQFLLKFENKTPKEDQFRAQINAMIGELNKAGIKPAATCAVCGGGSPESLYFNGSTFQPAHRSCVEKGLQETVRKAEDNKENGSYILGIVGAVIGALIGMIPSIILALIGYLAAVLFMLVPICAAYGYRKLGGKKNTASVIIIIVLSLISAFVVNMLVSAFYLLSEYHMGLGESLALVIGYYFGGNFGELITDSLQYLLFMALGVLGAIRYIFVTNKGEVMVGSKVAGTIRPNPAFNGPAAVQAPKADWSAGTVAQPTWDAEVNAQPSWDAGKAQSTWDAGASFEAGGKGKKTGGFDL